MKGFGIQLNELKLTFWILLIIATLTGKAVAQEVPNLPEIERKSLLNGMQFLFLDDETEQSAFVLMIENGAAFDAVDKWGGTNLMARLMVEPLTEEFLQRELTSRGVSISYRVGWDAFYFYGTAPKREIDYALSVLAGVVVQPNFEEEAFQRVKKRALAELSSKEDSAEYSSSSAFSELMFQDGPYGHPVDGTSASLEALTLRDVKIQARRLLLPNTARLAVFFSGDRETLFRRQSRRWGGWVRGEAAPFTFRKSSQVGAPLVGFVRSESDLALIRWGYLGVSRDSREYFTLSILEQYLTLLLPDFAEAVSGNSQIRGYVTHTALRMPGSLQVNLMVPPDQVVSYLAKLKETVQGLQQGTLDERLFSEAKSLALRSFYESTSTPSERLFQLLDLELYRLGVNFARTFKLRLDRVTPEVFQQQLRSVLPVDSYVIVAAGPEGGLKANLAEIGEVRVLN